MISLENASFDNIHTEKAVSFHVSFFHGMIYRFYEKIGNCNKCTNMALYLNVYYGYVALDFRLISKFLRSQHTYMDTFYLMLLFVVLLPLFVSSLDFVLIPLELAVEIRALIYPVIGVLISAISVLVFVIGTVVIEIVIYVFFLVVV